jgi:class 3 adenylate cyclase
VRKHGVEKIKTIGDAFMAAAGVPVARPDHAEALARLALDIQDVVADYNRAEGTTLSLRIGLHSGAVVAGVIGKTRFLYDLWGDTVNTASRMESHGVPGEVQVSETTAELLRGKFALVERGVVDVKGKGPMRTLVPAPPGCVGGPVDQEPLLDQDPGAGHRPDRPGRRRRAGGDGPPGPGLGGPGAMIPVSLASSA